MGYSKGTYVTKRIPLVGNPEQRTGASASKDQIFINFFPALTKTAEGVKLYLEQRGGLVYQNSTATGAGRGIYFWNGSIFSVIGNTLYRNSSSLQILSTSTGTVGFQEFAAGTTKYLIVLDGTSGWVITTTYTVTQITDVDFPTPHVVHSAYIDGYLVVAKAGTDDLYNSNIEDPFTWTAGDFITAEMFPDAIVSVCRQNNYVVAIGASTMEYFYDAGNAPGTPFARNTAAQHQMGTPAPSTVVQIEEQIIFVGTTQSGGRTVWIFNGFQPTEIGCEAVRQSLDNEGTNISNARAFCIRSKGHRFYVINLTNVTWAYEFDSQTWVQWADYTGASKFNCDYACDSSTGYPYMLDRTTGYVYLLTEGISKDATGVATTSNITSIAVSEKYDFGTMNAKFMHRLAIACDVPAGSNATSGTLYWTDDDYQTYSTGRTITISDTMPSITQLGRFRRRAFKFVWAQAYPIRIEGFEVDINLGAQ
jgi:hypothetical protein